MSKPFIFFSYGVSTSLYVTLEPVATLEYDIFVPVSISANAIIPPPEAVVKSATEAVADTPVSPIVIAVGLIEPTLAVEDTPVKPILIAAGVIEPTLAVAETPVTSINSTDATVISPVDIVASTPSGKQIHAKPNDPTEAVAARPPKP
jgi:hypothetical protein